MYNFLIEYNENSVNNSGSYNISYDNKNIRENVQFPLTISFSEYKPIYNISVTRLECGSIKEYTLINVATTQFQIPNIQKTTKIYVPPTTLPYTSTTEATTTSTTTIGTMSLTATVVDCYTTNSILFSRVNLDFFGNYSGTLQLQIKNLTTNEIVRNFTDGNIIEKSLLLTLRSSAYVFNIRDANNNSLNYTLTTPYLSCPTPSFSLEYIPNTCGKTDAKLRVYNIKNSTVFRYCFQPTFNCSNNFNNPDYILKVDEFEFLLNTNSGVDTNYTSGQFVTVRAFNQTDNVYFDVTVPITPCEPSPEDEIVKVLINYSDETSELKIRASLVKGSKKYITPIDVNVSGYYALNDANIGADRLLTYNMTIPANYSESYIVSSKDINDDITFICIDAINPLSYGNIFFINNSPCT